MNFNTTTVHGVELSKDQTGVTAKMSHSNYTMSVFFDGYTAQIHIKGPSGQVPFVEGLCGNSSINEARLSDNADICETKYEGTNDTTINCSKSTERCNLLPSIACHINPEPYVTACTNTLCKYPAVDGLNCQFLEAYARACSLYSNGTQDSWRSMANCLATPQAFCQDRFCSAHEFCGDDFLNGGTRCHCRAIFASPYRSENTLGDPVVCNDTAKLATLVGCLLEDKGIHYTDLHLYDKTCKAQMDDVTHMVTIGFDTKTNPCGTMIRMNNENQTINKNGVILESTGEEVMDFTCPFVIPEITIDFSMDIKVKEGSSSTSVAYVTFGNWTYTLTMKAFIDSRRTQPVDSNTLLHLNQRVWFELKADIIDYEKVALVTQSCYATNEPFANSSLRYNLIVNGCPSSADQTVIIESNGESASNYFSFRMFRFTGKNANVYLHCNLSLCLNENNSCIPNCSQDKRRRRSAMYKHEDINSALLAMAWST
ncbi:Uromodulin [Larimichthys crocea]|uniref:Uncharacterized protein n=1 Tax=Larimichthys crocea TaxID=215358 RepID=A0ACD3RJE8_LARCR|nr:Uromodulin [Larimichthys crocea]